MILGNFFLWVIYVPEGHGGDILCFSELLLPMLEEPLESSNANPLLLQEGHLRLKEDNGSYPRAQPELVQTIVSKMG
jgi:hypothetical protein